jgi:hypothetical protein
MDSRSRYTRSHLAIRPTLTDCESLTVTVCSQLGWWWAHLFSGVRVAWRQSCAASKLRCVMRLSFVSRLAKSPFGVLFCIYDFPPFMIRLDSFPTHGLYYPYPFHLTTTIAHIIISCLYLIIIITITFSSNVYLNTYYISTPT